MNNSLYEITREYLEAFDRLEVDEETGEILNFEAVDTLAGAFEEKAESATLADFFPEVAPPFALV